MNIEMIFLSFDDFHFIFLLSFEPIKHLMQYLIGVDLGTTSTKAVLFSTEGHVIASSTQGYPLYRDEPDMAEQDLNEIWEAFVTAVKEVVKASPGGKIIAVSFSSAMHSLIAFDKDWNPLTRLLTWADQRSVLYAEKLKNNGIGQQIYEHTGTPIHPMAPLSKLLWLGSECKEIFEHSAHFLGIKEYIFHKLFDANKMDISIASGTGLMNVFTLDWDEQAMKIAGVSKEQLPSLVDPYEIERNMKPEFAKLLNLPADTPFVYGAADGPLSNLGVDAIKPGVAAVTIGTSGAIRVVSNSPKIDPKCRTFTYALDRDHWVVGGSVNSGGDVFRWAKDNLFDAEKSTAYDFIIDIANKIPAGADGLIFHPYLGGERAPIWDANARGSFFGLSHSHTRAHMARALLEGIIFNLYIVELALEEVSGEINTIHATGGFAKSSLVRQMIADVFGKTVIVPTSIESGAFAATIIAQKALGIIESIETISNMISDNQIYEPNKDNFEVYRDIVPIFIRIGTVLQTEYREIASFQRKHVHKKKDIAK